MTTLSQVNKQLKKHSPNLELVKGASYFYFVYDDAKMVFETETVLVTRVNALSIDTWVQYGKEFLNKVYGKMS